VRRGPFIVDQQSHQQDGVDPDSDLFAVMHPQILQPDQRFQPLEGQSAPASTTAEKSASTRSRHEVDRCRPAAPPFSPIVVLARGLGDCGENLLA
jgi:hypothetical protein